MECTCENHGMCDFCINPDELCSPTISTRWLLDDAPAERTNTPSTVVWTDDAPPETPDQTIARLTRVNAELRRQNARLFRENADLDSVNAKLAQDLAASRKNANLLAQQWWHDSPV